MITDALARAPGATANDADQVLLKLKVIIKQQLIERAAVNAPPQATQPEPDVEWCKNAAKLLSNPWADAYQKQVMLELMRQQGLSAIGDGLRHERIMRAARLFCVVSADDGLIEDGGGIA